jgi:hypothetical protein
MNLDQTPRFLRSVRNIQLLLGILVPSGRDQFGHKRRDGRSGRATLCRPGFRAVSRSAIRAEYDKTEAPGFDPFAASIQVL